MSRNLQASGFSMIELSIVIALAGILTATCLQIFKIYRYDHIKASLSSIMPQGPADIAYERFVVQNNRFPCPADPALPETDANAGVEFCQYHNNPSNIPSGVNVDDIPTGTHVGGFWRVLGAHDTYGVGTPGGKNSVLIGSIPYTTLGLSPHDTYDPWGRKYAYAITEQETIQPPAQVSLPALGTIKLMDPAGNSIVGRVTYPVDQHPFVIWSYGSSLNGSYTPDGIMATPCDTTTPTRDAENCNNNATFLADTTPSTIRSLARGQNFYDTYIGLFELSQCSSDWCLTPEIKNSGAPSQQSIAIGIGTSNLWNANIRLDVSGNLKAPKVVADSVCDGNGDNCFSPKLLGGQAGTGIGYGPAGCNGEAIIGIANNKAVCPNKITPGGIAVSSCPSGKFATGISSSTGKIVCAVHP